LLHHLRARLGLVALQIVGKEKASGSRRAQRLPLVAHEDSGVSEQHIAVGIGGHFGTALANRSGSLAKVELRQRLRDWPPEPGAPRRGDDRLRFVGESGDQNFVVVCEDFDLVLCDCDVALEQQIFQGALQARQLLHKALAAVFLGCMLGLGNVIEQIDCAERRRENQQYER